MPRSANPVDFWRGFALITIFINHIPGLYFDRFTHRAISISDSAELFVFLAGWSLRYVVGPSSSLTPVSQLVFRLGGRAVSIYAAHMMIVMLAIAMLAAASRVLDNPLILEWHNAAAVFYDPVDTHIGLVMLSHQLGYFDILPLYVVLMLLAPGMAVIHRYAPNALLPVSLVIYFATLVLKIAVPSWPNEGQWFFNPLCWQLMFVLGFTMSRERGIGGWVAQNISWIRWVCLPIVLIGAVFVLTGRAWIDPTKVPEPKLLFINGKGFVTPIRVLQFLALAAVGTMIFPIVERLVPRLVEFLAQLGRNSLPVFCAGSVLSLAAQIVRLPLRAGLVVDTLIVLFGVAAMGAVAWLAEWRSRMEKPR